MAQNLVFSWANNAKGKLVHIDDVPRGLECGCFCPRCNEKLIARHGEVNEHGFAHHSKERGANLNICYMVTMYKLAEDIIQNKKRIHAPSYHEIFKETDIEFVDVRIDDNYEREDKQPDVIATTKDGKQYLIEFVFKYKVQHKKALDYKKLNCLEIDLSNQSLDTLEDFLLNSKQSRKWLNNEYYFSKIEDTYRKSKGLIRKVSVKECSKCIIKSNCCAVKPKGSLVPLIIENSGIKYRLCKVEEYEKELIREKQRKLEREKWIEIEKQKARENASRITQKKEDTKTQSPTQLEEISCFNCVNYLLWNNNNNGYASCGIHSNLGIPESNKPSYAKHCRGFKNKNSYE